MKKIMEKATNDGLISLSHQNVLQISLTSTSTLKNNEDHFKSIHDEKDLV